MPRSRSPHPLVTLCEESPQPVYALDEQRRIVACNCACAEWLGLTAVQLIGQRCDFAANEAASTEQAAAAALCPPPAVFLGSPASGQVVWKNASGEIVRRPAMFVPLRTEEPAAVFAVLGAVEVEEGIESAEPENAQSADLHLRLQQLARRMRSRYRLDRLVGNSSAIRRVREQVAVAIASNVKVLIVGPKGSGREHIARTIIQADQPDLERSILPVDCETLDLDLLKASISSLPRGDKSRQKTIESTLLLLNVDRLAPELQSELMAILRDPAFAGRVLATANRPLLELAAGGAFVRDLAFELSTIVVELPALRDRREDIPLLAQRMVEEHNADGGRQLAGFSPAALDRLASLPWVGNVEELSAVVREACQAVSSVWIGESDLPARVRAIVAAGLHPRREPETIDLDAFLLEVEKELMERAMRQAKGNKAHAARLLGVSRNRLLRRLEQLGLITREEPTIEFHPEEDLHVDPESGVDHETSQL